MVDYLGSKIFYKMKPITKYLKNLLLFSCLCLAGCGEEKNFLDSIYTNAEIYPVVEKKVAYDAIGVKDGKISMLGTTEDLLLHKGENTLVHDMNGQFLMAGFIEGHGHYSGLGKSLQNLNFLADTSWQQITAKVDAKISETEPGEWIYGRGWHQEKFTKVPEEALGKYPTHTSISELSKDHPVILIHASGHSLFANEKAMELAGVNKETPDPVGGKIIRNNSGEAIGVFEERAMTPIRNAYQEYLNEMPEEKRKEIWKDAIKIAEEECLSKGITSFQDAGSKFHELKWYEEMARNGEHNLRLWVMVRHSAAEMENKLSDLRMLDVGDGFYTCRAVKSELDGALGAHGAWLLEPYSDKKDFHGQNTTEVSEVEKIAQMAYDNEMQLCVHAIGDKANRATLDIFESYKNKDKSADLRWRVEHAQHLHVDDIPRFKEIGAIASMQGIHCTSDAPFVETRLGHERASEGAYAWRSLLDAGAVVVNGTDAPVEDVNPLASIYASITRKRKNPEMEFIPEQVMTREEALYSYTMAPAFAGFEEDKKGSIEIGKYADFVVLDKNILTCKEDEIENIDVLHTIVAGKIRYSKNQ